MVIQDIKEGAIILQKILKELTKNEIGYFTRVDSLIDEFFITAARALSLQKN
jgi:hypothetical protein